MNSHFVRLLLLITSFIAFSNLSFSQEIKEEKRLTLAVYKVKSNNCPQSIGDAIEEIIISRLYATSMFTLMERSQIDRIAQKNGIGEFDLADTAVIVKLGKLLNVQKIIVGSVNKVGNYTLEIRAIDISTGNIDHAVSTKAEDDSELDNTINKAVDSIERYYSNYGKIYGYFDISAGFTAYKPFGSIGKGISLLYGVYVNPSFYGILSENIGINPSFTYFRSDVKKDDIDSYSAFLAELYTGYRMQISKTLTVTPAIGFGTLHSSINQDPDHAASAGVYDFESRTYNNLTVSVKTEITLFIYNRWLLALTPALTYLPEKGNSSTMFGLNLGIKTIF